MAALEAVCWSSVVPPFCGVISSSAYGCSSVVLLVRSLFSDRCSQVERGLSETLPLVVRSSVKKERRAVFRAKKNYMYTHIYWLYEQMNGVCKLKKSIKWIKSERKNGSRKNVRKRVVYQGRRLQWRTKVLNSAQTTASAQYWKSANLLSGRSWVRISAGPTLTAGS